MLIKMYRYVPFFDLAAGRYITHLSLLLFLHICTGMCGKGPPLLGISPALPGRTFSQLYCKIM